VSPGNHVPGDQPVGRSGPADTAPDGHPEDGARYRDPGDHDSKSKELRVMADRSLLGRPILGGSGNCAMGDGQGNAIGKTASCQRPAEAVRLQVEDAEAQRLSPEDVGKSSARGTCLNNADGLVSRSDKLLGRGDTNQVYLVPIIKGEQVAMEVTAADRDAEDKNSRRRSIPPTLRLLTQSSPDRGSIRIVLIQYFIERGSRSSVEKGKRETGKESVAKSRMFVGAGEQPEESACLQLFFTCVAPSPPPPLPPPPRMAQIARVQETQQRAWWDVKGNGVPG
jgi:hypothetical protein